MIRASVSDGLILLTKVKILESTRLCYHEVISVVLQIVAEMVTNLVMAYVYFISKLVGNISYGGCGVMQDV